MSCIIKTVNCYIVAFEVHRAANRLKYFLHHLARCKKPNDVCKLYAMSAATIKYLSGLLTHLNDSLKSIIDDLIPWRITHTKKQLLLTQIAESNR